MDGCSLLVRKSPTCSVSEIVSLLGNASGSGDCVMVAPQKLKAYQIFVFKATKPSKLRKHMKFKLTWPVHGMHRMR